MAMVQHWTDIAEGKRFSRADPKNGGGISAKRGRGKPGHSQLTNHGGITKAVPQRMGSSAVSGGMHEGCQSDLRRVDRMEKARKEKARWSVETGVEIAATGYAANDE